VPIARSKTYAGGVVDGSRNASWSTVPAGKTLVGKASVIAGKLASWISALGTKA